eukprot:Tamp_24282.p1 GENE.Tamp_24282~~Tamp_24282.p1  ORF type:complete len:289 (+),score=65.98 Tamp_24282:57-869(+)
MGTTIRLRRSCVAAQRPAVAMDASGNMDRREMLAAAGGLALANIFAAPSFAAAVPEKTLKKAEEVKAAIKKIASYGSTGPLPTEDLVFAIIDDGSASELVNAAFLGAASSGAKAVKLKYNKKGGVAGREKTQAEYLAKDCVAVISPTVDPLNDLMQGTGLECNGCSYGGGGAPPKFFIILDDKGMTTQELSGEAGTTGWGCFDDKLALVPGNVFKQKPNTGKIKKCGPYGIQIPVLSLAQIEKIPTATKPVSLMSVEGVSFTVSDLPTGE